MTETKVFPKGVVIGSCELGSDPNSQLLFYFTHFFFPYTNLN